MKKNNHHSHLVYDKNSLESSQSFDSIQSLKSILIQIESLISSQKKQLKSISNHKKEKKKIRKKSRASKQTSEINQLSQLDTFDDLNKFYKYASQNTQGNFYNDALHDLYRTISGGERNLNTNLGDSPVLALAQFKPISSDGFVKSKYPFKALSKRVYILPIEQINTILPYVPIAPNPFQPYEIWGHSISSFVYKGKNPSYVQITGSLSVFVKLYNATPEQHRCSGKEAFVPPELWCEFFLPHEKPKIERSHRRGLAMDLAPLGKELFRMGHQGVSANQFPKNYDEFYQKINEWNETHEKPIDIRKISTFPKIICDYRLNDKLCEPIQEIGSHMTDWFLLPPCLSFTTNTDGTSSILRIQYRDEYDKIWFGVLDKNVESANKTLITIPSQARYARIFFSDSKDTAKNLEINFLPMEIDATYGMWAHYQLDVNSSYTFYPNIPFQIVLRFYGGNFFSVDSQSFFINSGGFQCVINVKDELLDIVNSGSK